MKIQEAIRMLKMEMLGDSEQMKCAKQIAIKGLEKHISKKPKMVKYEAEYDIRDYFCPICNKLIISSVDGEFYAGNKDCYCSDCGQRIDWNGTKGNIGNEKDD